jgi:glycosyltransferase involved in cell wall biosynthesis
VLALKRLLLVTYYFPPLAGSGVFRPLRFAKYLPTRGWQVTVLTVSERTRVLRDAGLLRDVAPDLRVERTASLEPRLPMLALNRVGLARITGLLHRWWMIPDDQRGWVPFAVRRASEVLAEVPHDAVLTTSAPYSTHLIGRRIKKKTGLPWLADFRDEWTTNPYLAPAYPTGWHRRLNLRLERAVLREADGVISVSAPWLAAHRGLVPDEDPGKFHVLTNGFDGEHHPPRPPDFDRFRIVYAGTFYGHRSPATFIEGLRRALERGLPPEETEVHLVGHGGDPGLARGLPDGMVRVRGHRPYFETLELLSQAAVLLIVVPKQGGAGNHTGKLFPYLASGRPILLQAPEPNVAAALVRETRSGAVVPPDDADLTAAALLRLHAAWRSRDPLPDQDVEAIGAFEGSRQAGELAALLDGLAG